EERSASPIPGAGEAGSDPSATGPERPAPAAAAVARARARRFATGFVARACFGAAASLAGLGAAAITVEPSGGLAGAAAVSLSLSLSSPALGDGSPALGALSTPGSAPSSSTSTLPQLSQPADASTGSSSTVGAPSVCASTPPNAAECSAL